MLQQVCWQTFCQRWRGNKSLINWAAVSVSGWFSKFTACREKATRISYRTHKHTVIRAVVSALKRNQHVHMWSPDVHIATYASLITWTVRSFHSLCSMTRVRTSISYSAPPVHWSTLCLFLWLIICVCSSVAHLFKLIFSHQTSLPPSVSPVTPPSSSVTSCRYCNNMLTVHFAIQPSVLYVLHTVQTLLNKA